MASGSFAADLPARKGLPVSDNLKLCDWLAEPGFYAIPGGDTCIRVGGYARAQYQVQSAGSAFGPSGTLGTAFGPQVRPRVGTAAKLAFPPATSPTIYFGGGINNQGVVSRAEPVFDVRTPTAWGPLKVQLQLSFDSGSGVLAPVASPQVVDKVFIQWAGITAGRADSIFKFYDNVTNTTYIGLRAIIPGITTFSYTQNLGAGLQASIAAEDSITRRVAILQATGTGPGGTIATANKTSAGTFAGANTPDVVGSLKLEQAWGKAQLSAAWHSSGALYPAGTGFAVRRVDGYAVLAGASINLPFLAPGDFLLLQGTFARGAESYLGATGTLNNPGASYLRADSDFFVNTANGRVQAEKGYNLIGHFQHYWAPNFWQAVYASYTKLTPGSDARRIDWTIGGISGYREWRLSSQFVWAPVKAFTIGVEGEYQNTRNDLAGLGTNTAPVGFKKDYSGWIGKLRFNRIF